MTRSPYTRSGTRRLGDDYQDLIACEVLIDWLEHSDRYTWVRVEADEAMFLDDVVAMLADGRLVVKQVKFSTNPEGEDDPLTWEKLLAAPSGKYARTRMSLLEKWAASLRELLAKGPIAEASVVSNRTAGDDLRAALNSATGLVDFDRIADDSTRADIVRLLGGESEARQFFGQFRFSLNEPSLNDLESSLRRRFDRLGGSETGWLNLKSDVRFWVSHRHEPPPDGAIKLSDVTRAARWQALQSLPQRFNVPRDYVVPSEEFHHTLKSSLLSTGGGCYVITASPGVGKSTYTSYLYDQLEGQETPVIRHHYYLSQDDQTGVARLAHVRAAESLMYDLKSDYAEALGAHAGENPVAHSLREWLVACGGFYARQGKRLIVIIDGLDHVWRDTRSVEELTKLLQFVLPAPEGVAVLLATQPVDDSQLPPLLLKYAPRDTWLRLPLLDEQAVAAWLRHHESELVPPAAKATASGGGHVLDYQFKRISEALYEKSRGHPLHLRYTLKALQERDQLVTVENIERLPGCTHDDIRDYYRDLWRVLPEDSRAILHLLAANRFPWTKRGIFECLNPDGTGYPALNNALRQVEHLLSDDGTGLRPFHASLLAFVENLPEHADYRTVMRRNALNWLRRDAPEYLRWAYVWTLEADLGDDRALREGPSREWLIESIARRYPRGQMLNILSQSIWCSLRQEDLPRAVEAGLLHDYCYRAFQSDPEVFEKLLFAQLKVADGEQLRPRLRARLSRLSETEAAILARHEAENGNVSFADECLDELAGRMRTEREQTHVEWKAHAQAIVEVAALLDDDDPARIVDSLGV
jgi:AAA domain